MVDDKFARPDPVELTADELKAVSGGGGCCRDGSLIDADVDVDVKNNDTNVNVLGIANQKA